MGNQTTIFDDYLASDLVACRGPTALWESYQLEFHLALMYHCLVIDGTIFQCPQV